MKVVLASHNPGKIQELKSLLAHLPIELILQSELGIPEIEETGLSFVENALIKARHASSFSNMPAIADDSGLAVHALNGAPGIYSARYAGKEAAAKDNIEKLLGALQSIPDEHRNAEFHCAIIFLSHAHDPAPIISEGIWRGMILHHPKGADGFGYDPVFYLPSENKTAAELTLDQKNKISHRGQALQLLVKRLQEK